MPNLVGIGNSQVPTNAMLGGLAYQDPDRASLTNVDIKDISAIKAKTGDSAHDVFVYDTAMDTDGGAWRHRCTNQSWYNETLGTPKRGHRREFPAVAVIVSSPNGVIIYDGDDPDLPMWMVFNTSGGIIEANTSAANVCSHALNAYLAIGTQTSNGSFALISFIKDSAQLGYSSSYGGDYNGNIAQRNDSVGKNQKVYTGWTHFYTGVKDIDMAVATNTETEFETGLPRPHLAVGTKACTHLILPDNTVYDLSDSLSYARGASLVRIPVGGPLRIYGYNGNGTFQNWFDWESLNSDKSGTEWRYNYTVSGGNGSVENLTAAMHKTANPSAIETTNDPREVIVSTGKHTGGSATAGDGVSFFFDGIDENYSDGNPTIFDSMVAYATTSFTTGYMPGDCMTSVLTETTSFDLTTGIGWTGGASTVSHNSNPNPNLATSATLEGAGRIASQNYSNGDTSWTITDAAGDPAGYLMINLLGLTTGKFYELTVTSDNHVAYEDGIPYVSRVDHDGGGETYFYDWMDGSGSAATLTGVFRAASTDGDNFVMYIPNESTQNISNFTIKETQIVGRTRHDDGFGVVGAVDREPVADGAELMCYNGFSKDDYIIQQWQGTDDSSSLGPQFGTSPFYVSCWARNSDTASSYRGLIWFNKGNTTDQGWQMMMDPSQKIYFYCYGASADNAVTESSTDKAKMSDGKWHHIIACVSAGSQKLYIDGILVGTATHTFGSVSQNPASLIIGRWGGNMNSAYHWPGDLALVRVGKLGAGTNLLPEMQIKKMYREEKKLFQKNAKCTIHGDSDNVTAMAYDKRKEILHVGTPSGRSDFQGLQRINNTTVGITSSISASNGLIAEQ